VALSANTVWEIRQDGDDDNGGGYKSDAGTTDYSQQAAAQLTVTDGATAGATNTTLTSATGGFTSAMVGNVVHVWDAGGGSNITDGWYEIAAYTDTNTVTLDRAPDDGNGGVSGASVKVGGALGTPGLAASLMAEGHKAYVKYNATPYTLTTATPGAGGPVHFGTADKRAYMEGYETTREDGCPNGNRPEVKVPDSGVTFAALTALFEGEGTANETQQFANLKANGNSKSNTAGFVGDNDSNVHAVNCVAVDCDDDGFSTIKSERCLSQSNGSVGFDSCDAFFCRATGNASAGIYNGTSSYCIADGNGGDGFIGYNTAFINCVAYNNSGDGFGLLRNNICVNCISSSHGSGYEYDTADHSLLINCASYVGSSGRSDATPMADLDAIPLSEDPFVDPGNVDPASCDFTLDPDGEDYDDLKAAGWGVVGQSSYADVGAVQHEDAGGGGGGVLRRLAKQYGIG